MGRRILAFVFAVITVATGTSAVRAGQETPAAQTAVDFSGAWIGTLRIPEPGERWQTNGLRVVLKQSGYALQGSLAFGGSQSAIANGRVEATQFGTSLSFQLKGPDFVMRFELRPDGDALRGVARVDGTRRAAPIELRRAPEPASAVATSAAAPSASATPAPAVKAPPVPASTPAPAPATNVASAAKSMADASKPFGFSGIYAGNFTLAGNTLTMYAVITQKGDDLSGTVGPDAARQAPITNGKVEKTPKGATLRFQMDLTKEQVVMTFELSPATGGLKGTVTAEHANQRVAGGVELRQLR